MSTITTRSGKGSPLTFNEVDANFNNLNTDKLEASDIPGEVADLTLSDIGTPASNDEVLIRDSSESDELKTVTVSNLTGVSQIYTDTSESYAQTGSITGLINGSNQLFTNSQSAYNSGTCLIFVNGTLNFDWAETSPAGGTITFTNPPQSGDEIVWQYSN